MLLHGLTVVTGSAFKDISVRTVHDETTFAYFAIVRQTIINDEYVRHNLSSYFVIFNIKGGQSI